MVHLEHLVVRNDARVGEVVNAREPAPRHLQRDGHHLGQHRHRVGDVDHLGVPRDLVDEVAVELQVVADGHAHAEGADVWVVLHHVLDERLCVRVEGAVEVRSVLLLKAFTAAERMRLVVLEDAAGREECHVDAALVGGVGDVHRADHVGPKGLHLVRLAPVHVGPASHARRVEDVRWLHAVELSGELLAVLEPRGRVLVLDPFLRAQIAEESAQPPRLAVDEHVHLALRHCGHQHLLKLRQLGARRRELNGERR
mmetsp:Transcript_18027/g.46182  ORF Transcript_18027/g.46182 Transcript_18027/m.46182 type:complete len:255 (+) Transcript_18027:412-1176(+)